MMSRAGIVDVVLLVLAVAGWAHGSTFVASNRAPYGGTDTDAVHGRRMIISEGRLHPGVKTLTDGRGTANAFFNGAPDRPNSGYWVLGPRCATRCVTRVDVWLNGEDRCRYVYNLEIAVSADGVTYTTVARSGKVTPPFPAPDNLARFVFEPKETRGVRYVRLVSAPTGQPHPRIREVDVFTARQPVRTATETPHRLAEKEVSQVGNKGKSGPLAIGTRRQLFLDDWVIERMQDLERRQCEPVRHPANPVLRRDKPWEAARCELYGSAIWDPEHQRLQLFYSNMSKPYDGAVAYAESTDRGVHWSKPELDIALFKGQNTNIVWPGRYWPHGPSVIRDPRDPDPKRRYKLFLGDCPVAPARETPEKGKLGIDVAFSPDGIHWTASDRNPVIPGFLSDTAQCVLWDPVLEKYVAYVRLRTDDGVRCVGRVDSTDFEHWSPRQRVYEPSPEDRAKGWQFYSLSATYYQGLYVGLVWIFPAVAASMDWSADTPATWPELAVSRNGVDWARVMFGKPFLPVGPPGSFDRRQLRLASSLVVLPDRILLFYSGSPHPHDKRHNYDIGLATLRVDGFVSLAAGEKEGELVTKALRVAGGVLRINAAVQAGGAIRAELLDAGQHPVTGYEAGRCRPFRGDSLAGDLTWTAKRSLPPSPPEGLRLRFLVHKAKLYSFWVQHP